MKVVDTKTVCLAKIERRGRHAWNKGRVLGQKSQDETQLTVTNRPDVTANSANGDLAAIGQLFHRGSSQPCTGSCFDENGTVYF